MRGIIQDDVLILLDDNDNIIKLLDIDFEEEYNEESDREMLRFWLCEEEFTWDTIKDVDGYSINDLGVVRNNKTGKKLRCITTFDPAEYLIPDPDDEPLISPF